ncbi:MFS transporter [Paenibacillus alginolyticus]|uniref:MFS transporter n=1 Tax=Paenibacillus alginolyticus TaxID=59839 RepID=A0ABT4GJT9_9BACL|nr:MFS transporter [Paenibacillus alginolyticus]MCY9696469.1 MFS transporter [Paenibacillus alginolyticus]MEC0144733.1 MFS transporter [Paenibacillus alginolyticus]
MAEGSELIKEYIHSPERQQQLYRRSLTIVIIAQLFGGAGLAAGVTVGGLLAQDMLGTDSLAGVPSALLTLGAASSALLVGRLSGRLGRRVGLTAGFFAGGIGAIGVVFAAIADNLPLLFASMLIYGAGTSTNLQARYAGTDLAQPKQRARAVSLAMVFTTFGAVAGPNLVGVMGRFATSVGAPALAGPFMLAAVAFILAGLVIWAFLRPDPYIVSKAIAEAHQANPSKTAVDADLLAPTVRNRGIIIGTTVMVLTQLVMVAIMTMTPVHMKHHGHGLSAVGMVIGIHVAAMFLPSLVTGVLVDKVGRTFMSYASGITLLLAGLLAAWAPADSMVWLIVALALLGLGWNFGLISGTAQIIDATSPATRAKTQGTVDVLVSLAGASGGALSGMVVANSSFAFLSLAGGFLSLLLIPVMIWLRRDRSIDQNEKRLAQ